MTMNIWGWIKDLESGCHGNYYTIEYLFCALSWFFISLKMYLDKYSQKNQQVCLMSENLYKLF